MLRSHHGARTHTAARERATRMLDAILHVRSTSHGSGILARRSVVEQQHGDRSAAASRTDSAADLGTRRTSPQKQHARCVCPIDCTHDKSTRCSWAAYVLGRNRCATEAKATRMPLRRETLRPSAQARRARGVQPLRRASSERTASSVERCTGQASISCCCLSSTSPPQQSPSQRLFHSDDHNT